MKNKNIFGSFDDPKDHLDPKDPSRDKLFKILPVIEKLNSKHLFNYIDGSFFNRWTDMLDKNETFFATMQL